MMIRNAGLEDGEISDLDDQIDSQQLNQNQPSHSNGKKRFKSSSSFTHSSHSPKNGHSPLSRSHPDSTPSNINFDSRVKTNTTYSQSKNEFKFNGDSLSSSVKEQQRRQDDRHSRYDREISRSTGTRSDPSKRHEKHSDATMSSSKHYHSNRDKNSPDEYYRKNHSRREGEYGRRRSPRNHYSSNRDERHYSERGHRSRSPHKSSSYHESKSDRKDRTSSHSKSYKSSTKRSDDRATSSTTINESDRNMKKIVRVEESFEWQDSDDEDKKLEEIKKRREERIKNIKPININGDEQNIKGHTEQMAKDNNKNFAEPIENETKILPIEKLENAEVKLNFADKNSETNDKEKPIGVSNKSKEESICIENDMFADDFDVENTVQKTVTHPNANADEDDKHLEDNYDDGEGYYKIVVGDILKEQYLIKSVLGKGVFSNVVCCHVLSGEQEGQEVAVKITRNNDLMYHQGIKELTYLKMLSDADTESKCHVLSLYGHFMFRNHLCIVLPKMTQNLRDLLKTYGKNIGISIYAVRSYAKQLFKALKLLMKCGLIHADIKPDNILVTNNNAEIKLADFGSVVKSHEIDYTPYLVSRFYRAPEIIIGHPFDFNADLWSVAVTLYELFTSQVMFPGSSNNQMLLKICELNGKVPNRVIRRSIFRNKHFDDSGNFILHEIDPITNLPKQTIIHEMPIKRDLHAELRKYGAHSTPHPPPSTKSPAYMSKISPGYPSPNVRNSPSAVLLEPKSHLGSRAHVEKKICQFKDLLENLLMIDPAKRMNLATASEHIFVQSE